MLLSIAAFAIFGTTLIYVIASTSIIRPHEDNVLIYSRGDTANDLKVGGAIIVVLGMAGLGACVGTFLDRMINNRPLLGSDKWFGYSQKWTFIAVVGGLILPAAIVTWSSTDMYVIGRNEIRFRSGPQDVWHHTTWSNVTGVEQYCRTVNYRYSSFAMTSLIFKMKDGSTFSTKKEQGFPKYANTNYLEVRKIARTRKIPYQIVNKSRECEGGDLAP